MITYSLKAVSKVDTKNNTDVAGVICIAMFYAKNIIEKKNPSYSKDFKLSILYVRMFNYLLNFRSLLNYKIGV